MLNICDNCGWLWRYNRQSWMRIIIPRKHSNKKGTGKGSRTGRTGRGAAQAALDNSTAFSVSIHGLASILRMGPHMLETNVQSIFRLQVAESCWSMLASAWHHKHSWTLMNRFSTSIALPWRVANRLCTQQFYRGLACESTGLAVNWVFSIQVHDDTHIRIVFDSLS